MTQKHIVEQFHKVGTGEQKDVIRGDAIRTLTRMCGQVLDINEERVLLKKSRSVSYHSFKFFRKEIKLNTENSLWQWSKSQMT